MVDGHVHVHDCFSWPSCINAAHRHFTSASRVAGVDGNFEGCLLLVDNHSAAAFARLHSGRVEVPAWSVYVLDEHDSVVISNDAGARVYVIAGRQIVTAENLEVLAVGCATVIPDGFGTRETIERVREQNAIPILPWGVGKWTGRRKQLVRDLLTAHAQTPEHQPLLAGDNGNRLRCRRRPEALHDAEQTGLPVIPGSDPLPIPSHSSRVGSYGFMLDSWMQTDQPAEAIRQRLATMQVSPPAFGTLAPLPRFVRDQFIMQWRRRIG